MNPGNNSMIQDNTMISRQIISNLKSVKNEAAVYSSELRVFIQQLQQVKSTQEFHKLVEKIVRKSKEVNTFLFGQLGGANKETKNTVNTYIASQPDMADLVNVLNFHDIVRENLIKTKERLSTAELLSSLPEEEKVIVRQFIDKIKALQPVAKALEVQKTKFRRQLSETDSLEKIVMEVSATRSTERGMRSDDKRSDTSMEDRKKQGYF